MPTPLRNIDILSSARSQRAQRLAYVSNKRLVPSQVEPNPSTLKNLTRQKWDLDALRLCSDGQSILLS